MVEIERSAPLQVEITFRGPHASGKTHLWNKIKELVEAEGIPGTVLIGWSYQGPRARGAPYKEGRIVVGDR